MRYFLEKIATSINIPRPPIGEPNIENGLNKVFFWAGIVAVVVIVLAGLKYVTSAGDPGKVATAKNAILYALVGLILVILSFTIVNFVVGLGIF